MKLNRKQLRKLIIEALGRTPAGKEAASYATAVYGAFYEAEIPYVGHTEVYLSPDLNAATMMYDGEEILTLYGNGAVSLSGNPRGEGAQAAQQALKDNQEILFDYIEQEIIRKNQVRQDRQHIDGY